MPEFAEVEFFRKRWAQAAAGQRIKSVQLHPAAKIFRGTNPAAIKRALTGAKYLSSEAQAKQMLFRFVGAGASRAKPIVWIGVHLGMSGDLTVRPAGYIPAKHDHLVLFTTKPGLSRVEGHALVFADPRMFGRVQFHRGTTAPAWWTKIAPPILSDKFTVEAVAAFLKRRAKAPIKAVLLMQERFPGIGNWMADEILWRAAIHPRRHAGSLKPAEVQALWRECGHVCRMALDTIAGRGNYLPPDLNAHIPKTWLFWHRWEPADATRAPRRPSPAPRSAAGPRVGLPPGRSCSSPRRTRSSR